MRKRDFEDEDRLFENVCDTCGELFITVDEDMTLCPNCWNIYLENQLKSQTCIRLTEEYINSLLSNPES